MINYFMNLPRTIQTEPRINDYEHYITGCFIRKQN